MENPRIPDSLRAAFCELMLVLYVDCAPNKEYLPNTSIRVCDILPILRVVCGRGR